MSSISYRVKVSFDPDIAISDRIWQPGDHFPMVYSEIKSTVKYGDDEKFDFGEKVNAGARDEN